jgi:hypothetical protein
MSLAVRGAFFVENMKENRQKRTHDELSTWGGEGSSTEMQTGNIVDQRKKTPPKLRPQWSGETIAMLLQAQLCFFSRCRPSTLSFRPLYLHPLIPHMTFTALARGWSAHLVPS